MANMLTATIGIDASGAKATLQQFGADVDALGNAIKTKLTGGNVDIATDKATSGLQGVATQADKTTESVKKVGTEGGKGVAQLPAIAENAKKALSGVGDIAKQALGLFGGGLLLKGVDGLLGGFGELFEKGLAIKKMTTNLEIGFRAAGVEADKVSGKMKESAKTVEMLADKYAVSKGALNEATAAFLKYGGTTDNLAQKQELIIGLAKKGGIEYEQAAKMLAKATDPENEANLKRLGIVLDKNASETDRFAKIQSKLAGTLEVTAEAARGPEGAIDRFKNALGGFKGAVGSAIIDVLAPVFDLVSKLATVVITYVVPAFKSFVGIIKGGVQALGPIIPIVAALAAGLVAFTIATEASFAATAKTWVLEKAQAVTKIARAAINNAETVSLQASTAAQWLWNAALSANPIGIVIIALTALIGGFILLYKYVAPVREFFDGAFAAVVPVLEQIWELIKVVGGVVWSFLVAPFKLVWAVIQGLYAAVKPLFASFFTGAGTSGNALKTFIGVLEKISWWVNMLRLAFAGMQNVIEVFVQIAGSVIGKLMKFDFSGAAEEFKGAGQKLGKAFQDGVKKAKDEAEGLTGEQKKQVTEAERVAAIIAKYAGAFDKAKQAADDMLTKANSDAVNYAQGIKDALAKGDREGAAVLRQKQKEALAQGAEAYKKSLELQREADENDAQKRYEKSKEFQTRTREAEENALKIRREALREAQKFDIEQITDESKKKRAQIDFELETALAAINEQERANAKAAISKEARAKVAEALELKATEAMREASAKRVAIAEEEAKKIAEIEALRYKTTLEQMAALIDFGKRQLDATLGQDESAIRARYALLESIGQVEEEKAAIEAQNAIREAGRKAGKTQEEIENLVTDALIANRRKNAQREREQAVAMARELEQVTIRDIKDAGEREIATKIANLKESYGKQLAVDTLSAEERKELEKKYSDELLKLTQEYIEAKYGKYKELTTEIAKQVNEQLEAERKANEAAREEYGKGTDELLAQLKAREIGYNEYNAKLEALRKKREGSERGENTLVTRLVKTTTTVATKLFGEQSAKQMKAAEEATTGSKEQFKSLGLAAAYTFGQMIANGDNFGKALLTSIAETVSKAIDLYIPQIFAAFAALGPFQIPAALATIATVKGLLAAASGGFKDGGYTGDGSPDDVAGVTHKKEFVFKESITSKYKKQFDAIHKGASPFEVFAKAPQVVTPPRGNDGMVGSKLDAINGNIQRLGGTMHTRQSVEVTATVDEKRFLKDMRARQRAAMRGR